MSSVRSRRSRQSNDSFEQRVEDYRHDEDQQQLLPPPPEPSQNSTGKSIFSKFKFQLFKSNISLKNLDGGFWSSCFLTFLVQLLLYVTPTPDQNEAIWLQNTHTVKVIRIICGQCFQPEQLSLSLRQSTL